MDTLSVFMLTWSTENGDWYRLQKKIYSDL